MFPVPPEDCVQEGPLHTGWELNLFRGNARQAFRQVPLESMIPIYMNTMDLFDEPRTIRAVWNHKEDYWTYRSWDKINKIPWAWMFSKGLLRREIRSRNIYHPAPPIGKHDFPFFNYATDTLYLYYGRCGIYENDQDELIEAMIGAANSLMIHQSNPNNPRLRFLQVTYCPYIDAIETLLDCFKDVGNLQQVTLTWHNHYGHNTNYVADWQNVRLEVKNGALKGYPWRIVMENHTGSVLYEKESPFTEEDEDSEGSNDW